MKASNNSAIKQSIYTFVVFLWLVMGSALTAQAASPVVDIKAMNADGPVSVTSGNELSLSIGLEPGDGTGRTADWWIVAVSGDEMQSLVVAGDALQWEPGLKRCLEYPLFHLPLTQIPAPSLNSGETTIVFALDDNADGIPDGTWMDTVRVTWNSYDEPTVVDVTFKSNTLSVSPTGFKNLLVSSREQIESGEFRFTRLPETLETVQPGTVVLLENYDVVKILSVTDDPATGETILNTEPAAITDLIEEGNISWKKGIGSNPPSGRRLTYDPLSNTVSHSGTVNGVDVEMSMQRQNSATTISFKGSTKGSGAAPVFSASIEGTLKDFNTRGDIVIRNGEVVSREYIVEDVDLDMVVAFGGQESLALDKKITLPAELKVPVYVSGIPFWIGIGGSLEFQSQASLDTSVVFKAGIHVTGDYGLREDKTGYTLLTGSNNKVEVDTKENDSVAMAGKIDMGVVYEFPRIALGMGTSLLGSSVYATTKTEIISRYTQEFALVGTVPIPCDPEYSGELNTEFAVGAQASVLKVIKLSKEEQIFYYHEDLWKVEGGCE